MLKEKENKTMFNGLKNVENGIGSLWYHTPYAMEGYLQDDGSIIRPSRWINSGDQGNE